MRNLVRETDSHNAALLAKEAADSKARLEQLITKGQRPDHDIRRRQLGNITAVLSANAAGKRRSGDTTRPGKPSRDRDETEEKVGRASREDIRTNSRRSHHEREEGDRDKEHTSRDRSHRRHGENSGRRRHRDRGSEKDRRRRSRSRSPSQEKSRGSSRRERSSERRPQYQHRNRDVEEHKRRPERRQRHTPPRDNEDDDDDPLEEIVGPLPPPKVHARGRGTTQASSGIDARFSEAYDPALDLSAADGEEGDDWDMVLDRVKWRQQGAERLRAAGFTNKDIEAWETGKKPEVRWAKSGEGREWDRGKDN